MRLISKVLLTFSFLLLLTTFLSLVNPKDSDAASCSFTLSTNQITPHTGSFSVTVTGETGGQYQIRFFAVPNTPVLDLQISTGTSAILNINIANINNIRDWDSGSFTIQVQRDQPSPIQACNSGNPTITVGTSTRTDTCSVTSQDTSNGQRFTILATGFLNTSIPHTILFGSHVTKNLDDNGVGNWSKIIDIPTNDFPPIAQGTYTVSISDTDGPPVICGTVTLKAPSSVSSGASPSGLVPGQNPCGDQCSTALGDIPTKIGPFASKILAIGTGLAGGLALILMVIGSIRVLTSSGDQQRLNGGREMIVAAIAGLLFLLFSVIILQFIGVSVIGIPGFKGTAP